MLVLTRRTGEVIKIGDHITITVLEIASGRVRLGIDAPKTTAINRGEVAAQIARDGHKRDAK
jgi:carbon storage regulator